MDDHSAHENTSGGWASELLLLLLLLLLRLLVAKVLAKTHLSILSSSHRQRRINAPPAWGPS